MSSVPFSIPPSEAASAKVGEGPRSELRGLRKKATRASAFRMGGYAAEKGIQLSSNVILSHIIGGPRAWGVLMLAQILMQGLKMFSEVGIGSAIIQNPRGKEPAFLDTAWTIQVYRGVLIWIVGSLLAWPLAVFYGEPMLIWMVPVLGLGNVIAGLQSTSVFVLNRELSEGRRTVLTLVEKISTRVSTVLFALLTPSAWAFVFGSLLGMVAFTIGSHKYLRGHRNRFRFDPEAAKGLLSFGKWIFVGTIIAFFAQQADKLLIGKIDDLSALGVYAIALTISKLPTEMIGTLTIGVLFPVLSEIARSKPERFPEMVARIRAAVYAPALFAVLAVVLGAPWFFRLLYPEAFHEAGWMAALSAGGAWIMVMDTTANKALLAKGHARPLAFAALVDLVATVPACLAGYHFFGMAGFIIGTVAGAAIGYGCVQWSLARLHIPVYKQDLCWTAALVVLAVAGTLASRAAEAAVPGVWGIVAGIGVSVAILAPVGAWAAHRTQKTVWKKRKAAA